MESNEIADDLRLLASSWLMFMEKTFARKDRLSNRRE